MDFATKFKDEVFRNEKTDIKDWNNNIDNDMLFYSKFCIKKRYYRYNK